MISTQQTALLDELRYGSTLMDRNQAFKDLLVLESEGTFEAEDFLKFIDNNDFVFQTYAIGAIGRLKIKQGISKLKKLFEKSNDSIILTALLETFSKFESGDFTQVVIKKLELLTAQNEKVGKEDSTFLLEQIIIPALKYLQVSGANGIEGVVVLFLNDANQTVRWHTLMTFDKLVLVIESAELEDIRENDKYALVREQASLMLEKRSSLK